jgi:hypothetical protein
MEGDTGRVGGTGTLDELCGPVDPTLGGEGRAGTLDARPTWVMDVVLVVMIGKGGIGVAMDG